MNTEMDQLTRSLMKESLEQPSSSLNSRIMALIKKEKHVKPEYTSLKTPSLGTLFAGLAVYLVAIISLFSLFQLDGTAKTELIQSLKSVFPFILTIGSGISFFFLYGQLDRWLWQKEALSD